MAALLPVEVLWKVMENCHDIHPSVKDTCLWMNKETYNELDAACKLCHTCTNRPIRQIALIVIDNELLHGEVLSGSSHGVDGQGIRIVRGKFNLQAA